MVVLPRELAAAAFSDEVGETSWPPSPRVPRLLLVAFAMLGLLVITGIRRFTLEGPEFSASTSLFQLVPFSRGNEPHFFDTLLLGERAQPALGSVDPDMGEPEPTIRREGHVSIPGGILVFPSTFQPASDGAYDLIIHFHGNTKVVKESVEVANINAAVAIINLGIGSAPYEEYYGVPGTYEELLDTIDAGIHRRGVQHPKLRRVALSAWSAGYGSVATIMQLRRGREDLDAVLMFDGIHAGWEGEGVLNPRQMKPFVDIAKKAALGGELYFGMTHSAIDPVTYAGTSVTAQYLIKQVGAVSEVRDSLKDAPPYVNLESMKGAVSKRLEKTMEPTLEAHKLNFHVLGYKGETKEHHMAHLFQMSATLLPELRERWANPR